VQAVQPTPALSILFPPGESQGGQGRHGRAKGTQSEAQSRFRLLENSFNPVNDDSVRRGEQDRIES
jgi:hypothetical protein